MTPQTGPTHPADPTRTGLASAGPFCSGLRDLAAGRGDVGGSVARVVGAAEVARAERHLGVGQHVADHLLQRVPSTRRRT